MSEPQSYRLLNPGEIIQEGDEIFWGSQWIAAADQGHKCREDIAIRRPISSFTDQTTEGKSATYTGKGQEPLTATEVNDKVWQGGIRVQLIGYYYTKEEIMSLALEWMKHAYTGSHEEYYDRLGLLHSFLSDTFSNSRFLERRKRRSES